MGGLPQFVLYSGRQEALMSDYVAVAIPVRRDVAELLRDKRRADQIGKLVSEMLRPSSPASDPLAALIREVKADARAGGLTDEEIDAELAAYNAEHRPRCKFAGRRTAQSRFRPRTRPAPRPFPCVDLPVPGS